MIWSLSCTGLVGVGFGFACASRTGTWAAGLGFAFSGLVSNLFNRLDSLNKTGWERGSRERTGTSSPFSQCRHGSMPELSLSSTGMALPASILEAKGMVRERRARGSILGLPTGVAAEEGGCHGRPWMAAWGALLGQREG